MKILKKNDRMENIMNENSLKTKFLILFLESKK